MKFLVTLAAVFAVANSAPLSSLNALIGANNLVPAHLDTIQTKSGDSSAILGQLKAILEDSATLDAIYEQYQATYGKKDETDRVPIFAAKVMSIAEHNVKYHAGETTYSKGVNQFTDLTSEEFMRGFTGLTIPNAEPTLTAADPTLRAPGSCNVESPPGEEEKDWRKDGIVTSVKNQGQCGSCVTFATNTVVESAMITAKKGSKPDLSEQELVDCTTDNNGCNGGWYDASFNYIKDNGVASERDYKYRAKDGECQTKRRNIRRAIRKSALQWTNANPGGDEESLRSIISEQGPAAVAVGVDGDDWGQYREGIFQGACAERVNHAVAVVGYGEEDGQKYWIVKNSWGTGWGENGYMRLTRGDNHCSVANYAYTAKV